jgi:hypothetical protein
LLFFSVAAEPTHVSILDRILSRIDAGLDTDLNTMLVDCAVTEFERDTPAEA